MIQQNKDLQNHSFAKAGIHKALIVCEGYIPRPKAPLRSKILGIKHLAYNGLVQ